MRTIMSSNVLIPVGEQVLKNNILIDVNETGVFMYKQLESGMSAAELADAVCAEYEADRQLIERDVKAFIEKLTGVGALEVIRE